MILSTTWKYMRCLWNTLDSKSATYSFKWCFRKSVIFVFGGFGNICVGILVCGWFKAVSFYVCIYIKLPRLRNAIRNVENVVFKIFKNMAPYEQVSSRLSRCRDRDRDQEKLKKLFYYLFWTKQKNKNLASGIFYVIWQVL